MSIRILLSKTTIAAVSVVAAALGTAAAVATSVSTPMSARSGPLADDPSGAAAEKSTVRGGLGSIDLALQPSYRYRL
ncbi:hypothetical protein [Streptomyces sp. NPDC091371]|uniref:hypothetical protein n=1 Tax=Streptomyces sp. NPDC091371 TaxID=3155303 RepID=UPI00341EFD88